VKSEARIAEGAVPLDSRNAPLTITEPYVPPFQESSADLVPEREAILATPGGEVTIRFPRGSVISPVHVTVKPPMGTLPEAPVPAKAGTTALTLEGITGLLTMDATVVVKYTADDLKAADGDPSRLSLARWDADKSRWTLLPTTVDQGERTLTAGTNRPRDHGGAGVPAASPWSRCNAGKDPGTGCHRHGLGCIGCPPLPGQTAKIKPGYPFFPVPSHPGKVSHLRAPAQFRALYSGF